MRRAVFVALVALSIACTAKPAPPPAPAAKVVTVKDRILYGDQLRERFLADGLDVEVAVTGKPEWRELALECVLFGDVWEYKLRKGPLAVEFAAMGFRVVKLSDGRNWRATIALP